MVCKHFSLGAVLLLSVVAFGQSYIPPNEFPLYTTIPPARQTQYVAWVWRHARMVSGGHNDLSSGMRPGQYWNRYVDAEGFYVPAIYPRLYVTADANRFDPEGAFLHYSIDYVASNKLLANGDQFDLWETLCCGGIGDPYTAVNGVMDWNKRSYTDVTRDAYCPAPVPFGSACSTYTPKLFTVTDHLLLGRQIPFYAINVTVATGRVGGSVAYKYWNGSTYAPLTAKTDTTNGLQKTGTISFLPPADWVRNVDQGNYAKYHVQIQITDRPSTNPVISRVYSDNTLTTVASATITSVSLTSNVATVNASNSLLKGQLVFVTGLTLPATRALNGAWTIVSANATQFTFQFRHADIGPVPDSGVATVYKNRGWNPSACVSGHINAGTPVEYCDVPGSASSAKMRAEARLLTGYNYNQFFGNQLDVQGGKYTWAYAKLAEANYNLTREGGGFPGMNGMAYDDAGASPGWAGFSMANTEYGSTTAHGASAIWFPVMYQLFKSAHPTFIQGMNAYGSASWFSVSMSMDFVHNETTNDTTNSNNPQTDIPLNICPHQLWCPPGLGNNPTVFQIANSFDNQQYALKDFYGAYHTWNMGSQGPITALAMYYLIKNPNVLFAYNPLGNIALSGQDEYYYWVTSSATLSSDIAAKACTTASPCNFTISGDLARTIPACPDFDSIGTVQTNHCPLRIGGTDVVPSLAIPYGHGYTGTSFSITQNAFVHSHVIGEKIEYMVRDWQSTTTGPFHTPIAMWGYHIPASDVYLGIPDPEYGFNTPCRNDSAKHPGVLQDCQWLDGKAVSGNPQTCDAVAKPGSQGGQGMCSPVLRRDYTNGTYGNAIVLLRPASSSSDWHFTTASSEFDTPSKPIPLPGTYYRLNSDGTIDPNPLSSVQLVGRDSFIGLSRRRQETDAK